MLVYKLCQDHVLIYGFYKQVIYTVGRDLQYQQTVIANAAPLVTGPVVVCICHYYFNYLLCFLLSWI